MKHRAQCGITDYYGLAKSSGYLRLICSIIVPLITRGYKTNSLPCECLLLFPPGCSSRQDDVFNISIWIKTSSTFGFSGCKRDPNHILDFLLLMRQGQQWHNNNADLQAQSAFGTHGHWCAVFVGRAAGLRWAQTSVTNRQTAAPPVLTWEQLPTSEKWWDKADVNHQSLFDWVRGVINKEQYNSRR